MDGGEGLIKFTAVEWSEDAEIAIDALIDPVIKPEFKSAVVDGRATLWQVTGDGWKTWLVTRVEKYRCGHLEMVLEVIAGSHARAIVSQLMEKVKPLGVQSIRFETHHPEKTAARLISGLGFERAASIFRVNL